MGKVPMESHGIPPISFAPLWNSDPSEATATFHSHEPAEASIHSSGNLSNHPKEGLSPHAVLCECLYMCLGAVPVHVFVDAHVHVCGEPVHRSIYSHKGPSLAKGVFPSHSPS